MKKGKLVLAYSGGLDTSVILHWLTTQGYDVVALCLDLGQKVDDLDEIRRKGATAGASKVLVENVQEEFVREYVFPALQWNAIYEGTYLLGTALARHFEEGFLDLRCALAERLDLLFVQACHGDFVRRFLDFGQRFIG